MASDNEQPIQHTALAIQSLVGDSDDERAHDQRTGTRSKHYLTMLSREDTDWIVVHLRDRIRGKDVIEIGAGVGVLACELAKHARRVFAVEADPGWNWAFVRHLYRHKPNNLTWIFDNAQALVGLLHVDVAVVVTGSDSANLRTLGGQFAPDVVLPWQDWNGGKPISGWSIYGPASGSLCSCLFGCVLDGEQGPPLRPREHCTLRATGMLPEKGRL
jgi:hypothetical protein